MIIINTCKELQEHVAGDLKAGKTIGFVPTMGALHEGHLSLIKKAHEENQLVYCSIFVNPLQFNDKHDLETYPQTLEADCKLIEPFCDVVFAPTPAEMYPSTPTESYNFGALEQVMEGVFRPGHFNGVGVVVGRLLKLVQPTNAYFGEKDYQQLAIIRQLVKQLNLKVNVVPCPIVRETSGLALSSRNRRLSAEDFKRASFIYETLSKAREMSMSHSLKEVQDFLNNAFATNPHFKVDYISIADGNTLQPINDWSESNDPMVLVAVYLGGVRLIDNMKLCR